MAPDFRRYTQFVVLFKLFLWFLVIGMIGVVIWISSFSDGDGTRIVLSSMQKTGVTLESVMKKPYYQGVDANSQPYTIVADKATQIDENTVLLDNIRADMALSNGAWVGLNAGSGQLDLEKETLALKGGVSVFYEGGYEFHSDYADVDIQAGSARGDAPVTGQGPAGMLTADSFAITSHGDSIRFNGSVTMTLYP